MNTTKELRDLYEEDQKDRHEKLYETKPELFRERDERRLTRAKEILEEKENLLPESLSNLAMLFQHGREPDDYKNAFELSKRAVVMGYEDAKWLTAATEDRYLLSLGKKQKWGTQFEKDENVFWKISPMSSDEESGVTDKMREDKKVPPRANQLENFLNKLNS